MRRWLVASLVPPTPSVLSVCSSQFFEEHANRTESPPPNHALHCEQDAHKLFACAHKSVCVRVYVYKCGHDSLVCFALGAFFASSLHSILFFHGCRVQALAMRHFATILDTQISYTHHRFVWWPVSQTLGVASASAPPASDARRAMWLIIICVCGDAVKYAENWCEPARHSSNQYS